MSNAAKNELAEESDVAQQMLRLRQFFFWDILASLIGVAFVLSVHLSAGIHVLAPVAAVVAGNGAILVWARHQAVRGRIQRAVLAVCLGMWLVLLSLSYLLPVMYPLWSMLGLWPIVIPLPFISGRPLRLVLTISTLVTVGVGVLSLRMQPELAAIPKLTLQLCLALSPPFMALLFSLILKQYSARLNETLQLTRAANLALRESERLLEEKVRQRTRELSEARDEALAATRAKSTFLANMSHELRTPLNAVLGYSEMLQEDALEQGKPELVPDLQRIHTAGKHLLSLINDVLDLSKIEAGKLDLVLETFRVSALVDEVVQLIRPALKREVTMQVRCDESVGTAHADATKVRQALFNLLSNACKFTERGTITLEVARAPLALDGEEGLVFRVSDTGIGIPIEDLSRLFQPFSQGNATTGRKYGGTGLGLAISRRFCQLMGGDITVSSQPGRGSIFTICIPTTVSAERRSPTPQVPAVLEPVTRRTVLVIDDDESARVLVRRFLEREGYRVHTASDGEEGLRLIRALHPQLVLLDVLMPRLDGWAVLSTLKREPAIADIPVLLLTIVDQKEHALAHGAIDLLTKPVDRERLAAVVTKHARPAPAGRSLLLVDDDPTVRDLLRRLLERQDWTISEAEDGRRALEQLDLVRPDLILLDLMMPGMDGFAFLDELSRRGGSNAAPVVLLTSKDLTEDDRHRLGDSVARILQKARLDGDGMVRALDQVLDARRATGAPAREDAR